MKKDKHLCPVCGFDNLSEPPYNKEGVPSYEVCPCCGFEFGFDPGADQDEFNDFRRHWMAKGAPWFMPALKPKNWDIERQLKKVR